MTAKFRTRRAEARDADSIARIYNEGIEDRVATFETEKRDGAERRRWLLEHDARHPVIVAEDGKGRVVGWASISSISQRKCYSGVGEYSVYVGRESRGKGVGTELLSAVIEGARSLGYWKLLGRMFASNETSRALARRFGFRDVGVLEKHGKLDGKWLDVLEVEKVFPENLD